MSGQTPENLQWSFQIGDLVVLRDLQNQKYNGKHGTIEGFNEQSKRFIVRLTTVSHPKCILAKNMELAFNNVTITEHKLLNDVLLASTWKEVSVLSEVVFYEDVRSDIRSKLFVFLLAELCRKNLRFGVNRDEIECIRDRILEEGSVSDNNTLKLELMRIYYHLHQYEECRKLAHEMKEEHFGKLPCIYAMLSVLSDDLSEKMSLFRQIKSALKSGNYSRDWKFWKTDFYYDLLKAIPVGKSELADEINGTMGLEALEYGSVLTSAEAW